MKTTLIQRGRFRNKDHNKGIDSIISFDYMGSTEFENGALSGSLMDIRTNIKDYVYFEVMVKGKAITVFCTAAQKEHIEQYLLELSENRWRLQEYSDFDTYISSSSNMPNRTDHWWDIENNFMFWKWNTEFETKFKFLIKG